LKLSKDSIEQFDKTWRYLSDNDLFPKGVMIEKEKESEITKDGSVKSMGKSNPCAKSSMPSLQGGTSEASTPPISEGKVSSPPLRLEKRGCFVHPVPLSDPLRPDPAADAVAGRAGRPDGESNRRRKNRQTQEPIQAKRTGKRDPGIKGRR